ncbi:hypothetical protein [Aneurinibacillus aneurinilyticus]|uniref:Uncharacterized protein n=1 Tax=Aneurinibacillus aneurinilyticus ATCC 12856 TaxID=649747 RepID=U1WSR8_ANEAE|nr:hypothetical protein [Aneurinibacillus aneurinilyticus]ERI11669.1 hypothetical protein HMPREF0083_00234 [Aneurinibacillus aneurinilyticus ATCC 12856]MED0709818.1 hypothetical protein [Aneurinibacillus aneurinilyticus]MED0726586.1 hypothetical protein [Aneurinibacillus aneurinilyticus]MED0735236.1 hypothetical protein [Aneurinibacillus aneurinilyticus]MED0744304.1 hypothetical protein [Aneurinibacillus aneurinilyticus]
MVKVSAIIQDPYFDQPSWLSKAEYRENVVLSKLSSIDDAVLFFTLLCGYNDVDVARDPTDVLNELIATDEVVIRGGITFEDKNKVILPSCCCGLENWRDVLEAVISKEGVWLGHNPFPSVEYIDNTVRIWSDDFSGVMRKDVTEKEIRKMYYIEYSRDDLIKKLQSIETDLLDFYKCSFKKALWMVDDYHKEMLFLKYCKWFNLDVK